MRSLNDELKLFSEGKILYLDVRFRSYLRSHTCIHEYVYEDSDYICTRCSHIKNDVKFVNGKYGLKEFWPRTYARIQYFESLFKKLTGQDYVTIPDYHRDDLVATVPNPGDWYEVFHAYRSFDLKPWWVGWNKMCDHPERLKVKRVHYNLLLYVDGQWESEERVKKKINVLYVLFKIVEMNGDDVSWVPMKLRANTVLKLDLEWKRICQKFQWDFKPTSKKLSKFVW